MDTDEGNPDGSQDPAARSLRAAAESDVRPERFESGRVTQSVDQTTGLVVRDAPNPYPVGPHSMARILDTPVADKPNAIALIDGDRSWSYRELARCVQDSSSQITAAGIQSSDRLAWSTPNCAEMLIAFLACQRNGVVWVGLDRHLTTEGRQTLLEQVDAAKSISDIASAKWLFDDDIPFSSDEDLGEPDVHSPAAIAFTSGTTGTPKAVVHSQHSMLAPAAVSLEEDPPDSGERVGTPLAMTVLNVMLLGPVSALARGSTAVIMTRTHAEGFSADIAQHHVTKTFVVPTMLHDLLHGSAVDEMQLESVRSMVSGGAGANREVRQRFDDRFGIRPQLSYGLTEAPTGVAREDLNSPIGDSKSYALPHVELLEVGGEICVRPTRTGRWKGCWAGTLGYWNDPGATTMLYADGLMHTGDAGSVGSDGAVTVTGRRSGMIVRGGANIDPAEIELALRSVSGVLDACVVGVADARLGQRVVAVVQGATTAAEVLKALDGRLARHKIPAEVKMVDELPRNAMGKIDQAAIGSWFRGQR